MDSATATWEYPPGKPRGTGTRCCIRSMAKATSVEDFPSPLSLLSKIFDNLLHSSSALDVCKLQTTCCSLLLSHRYGNFKQQRSFYAMVETLFRVFSQLSFKLSCKKTYVDHTGFTLLLPKSGDATGKWFSFALGVCRFLAEIAGPLSGFPFQVELGAFLCHAIDELPDAQLLQKALFDLVVFFNCRLLVDFYCARVKAADQRLNSGSPTLGSIAAHFPKIPEETPPPPPVPKPPSLENLDFSAIGSSELHAAWRSFISLHATSDYALQLERCLSIGKGLLRAIVDEKRYDLLDFVQKEIGLFDFKDSAIYWCNILILLLIDCCAEKSIASPLAVGAISQISAERLFEIFNRSADSLYPYVFDKFCANRRLFQVISEALGLFSVGEFIDRSIFFVLPWAFFGSDSQLETLTTLKGVDTPTFVVSNLHVLIAFLFCNYEAADAFSRKMEKLIAFVRDLSGNAITMYDLLGGCFQEVIRVLLLEDARLSLAGKSSLCLKGVEVVSQIVISDATSDGKVLSLLLKRCFLRVFYDLCEQLNAAKCPSEITAVLLAINTLLKNADSATVVLFLAHLVPAIEVYTITYPSDENTLILIEMWRRIFAETSSSESLGEFLLIIHELSEDFSRELLCQFRDNFCTKLLFTFEFDSTGLSVAAIVQFYLPFLKDCKFERVFLGSLRAFNEFLKKASLKELVESCTIETLSMAVSTLFGSLSKYSNHRQLILEVLSRISYYDRIQWDFYSADRTSSKTEPSEVFSLEYPESRSQIQNLCCSVLEHFLVPTFRACRDSNFQDKLAFMIQELLRVSGFSHLVIAGQMIEEPSNCTTQEIIAVQRWRRFPQIVCSVMFPFLRTKYTISFPSFHARSFSEIVRHQRINSFTFKEWIYVFFCTCLSFLSCDYQVEFFLPFKAIVTYDDETMKGIISLLVLCCILDPSKHQEGCSFIVEEVNLIFEKFASDSCGDLTATHKKVIDAIFRILSFFKSWIRCANHTLKSKSKTAQVPLLNGLQRVCDLVFNRLDVRYAAIIAAKLGKFPDALLFLEQDMPQFSGVHRSTWVGQNFGLLKKSFTELGLVSDLRELLASAASHSCNRETQLLYEIEGDWRGCSLVSQGIPNNQSQIQKCLYMLGMNQVILQNTEDADPGEYFYRSVLALKEWNLLEGKVSSGNFPCTVALVDAFKKKELAEFQIERLIVPNNPKETCFNLSLWRDLQDEKESAFKRSQCLGFDSFDRMFCVHIATQQSSTLWLERAKIARKNRLFDLAFASLLRVTDRIFTFDVIIERARILWHQGYRTEALLELKRAVPSVPLVESKGEFDSLMTHAAATMSDVLKAKLLRLTARWMDEMQMNSSVEVLGKIRQAVYNDEHSEKGHYMFARYNYRLYVNELAKFQEKEDVEKFCIVCNHAMSVVRSLSRAALSGTRYIFETVPRFLNTWLDISSKYHTSYRASGHQLLIEITTRIEKTIEKLISRLAPYQWFVGLSVLIARFNHVSESTSNMIQRIILHMLKNFPDQTMWFLFCQAKSTNPIRRDRFNQLKAKVKDATSESMLVRLSQCAEFFTCILQISNYSPAEKNVSSFSLNSVMEFRGLTTKVPCLNWAVPITDSLVPTLPSDYGFPSKSHCPFEGNIPTIVSLKETVEVLNSLQRPKKITIVGSNGREYTFLCKPKDDLRIDARVMDFLNLTNKLCARSKEFRWRGGFPPKIHCYCVLPLNDECGMIEWVPRTICYRTAVTATYSLLSIGIPARDELQKLFELKMPPGQLFSERILPLFPTAFGSWFQIHFSDSRAWFEAKKQYAVSLATMSVVGYVLGLGDRHGENIMLNEVSGAVIHVDFNCLFEKGFKFAKPERVPFRLTHNMQHALGVNSHRSLFKEVCMATMRVLRADRDALLGNLEVFIHDPVLDFSKKKNSKSEDGEVVEATRCIMRVREKLMGIIDDGLPLSEEGQITELIQQATDLENLGQMFIGWAAYL